MQLLTPTALALLTLTSLAALPAPADQAPAAPAAAHDLTLTLAFAPRQKLRVSFQNDSPKPLVLNLGDMLGNGASLFPSHLSIVLTDSENQSHSYHKAPGFIGGRVDDWLIPLAPGDSYALTLSPDELTEEKTAQPFQLQPRTMLTAHFTGIAPTHDNGNATIPALPVWKGSTDSPKIAAATATNQ
jgi:hypothetical protein